MEGAPFPAHLDTWDALLPTVLQLLASLSAIHRAGLVHRDLKPGNVLVTPSGQPVILDLGLTRGHPVGSTITTTGAILGTPRYLSPEQLQSGRVDGRADLYALGVMLFEALAGRPPHEAEDWVALWTQRVHEPAPLIHSLAPGVPSNVGEVVDALLDRDPAQRPATADVVAEMLEGSDAAGPGWLGPRDALDALIEAVGAHRTVFLWGPRGSGRTHHLRRLDELVGDERPTCWLPPSPLPLGSLEAFHPAELADDVAHQTRHALTRFLTDGGVLLADDWHTLDEWSQHLVSDLTEERGLVAVRPHADAVPIPTMDLPCLRRLFDGPERLFHLPSDAAELLLRRSGGSAGAVLRELKGWERLGHAKRHGATWHVDRSGLEALTSVGEAHPACVPCPHGVSSALSPQERKLVDAVRLAWPHASLPNLSTVMERPSWQLGMLVDRLVAAGVLADDDDTLRIVQDPGWRSDDDSVRRRLHLDVAAALPPRAPARLHHLLAGGGDHSLGTSLLAEIERRWEAGSRLQAVRLAEEGLRLVEAPPEPILLRLTQMGTLSTADTLAHAIEDLLRRYRPDLADIVVAGQRARAGEPTVVDLPEPLRVLHWYLRWEGAHRAGSEDESAVLEAAERWATGEDAALVQTWKGLSAYRAGRTSDAMTLHLQASELRHTEVGRLSSLLNAAAAALESCLLTEAEGIAGQAIAIAQDGRHWLYEARAEWVLRSVANRRGAKRPDRELLDAIRHLDNAFLRGAIRLTEAMISQRGGLDDADQLSLSAAADFEAANNPWGALHARALHAHVTLPAEDVDEQVLTCPIPSLTLDALALHAAGRDRVPEAWRAAARSAIERLPDDTLEFRRGYYSPREAAVVLGIS